MWDGWGLNMIQFAYGALENFIESAKIFLENFKDFMYFSDVCKCKN
jgi:hypothetical protein